MMCPYKKHPERHTERREERDVKTEAEIRVVQLSAKEAWSHQKLEEAREDPPLEPSEGAQPASLSTWDIQPPEP